MAGDLNDWFEAGGKVIGEGLEWAGDKAADGLDKVGWHDGANAVRGGANAVANRLGAEVGEVELGQTDDPKKLIHGSASKLRATASHLSDFQAAFDLTGEGLKGLDHDGIQGASAEAFRTKAQKQPPRWFAAADAFETAAGALNRFADTVEWAQGRAKEALNEYKTAVEMSVAAHDAYNKWVDSYNVAVRAKQDPLPARPMGFTDPGTDGIKAAREKLAEARRQRDEAARAVVQTLRTARDAAPPLPSAAMQLASEMFQMGVETEHVGAGVVKGAAGAISFFRAVDPTDPYNRMHPTEYKMQLSGMGVGLMSMVNDPDTAASRMYDSFMKDPGEGIGKILFEAATTKGAGAGASAIRRGAALGRLANGELPKPHLPDAPDRRLSPRENLNENKPDKSREQDCKTCVDDPVDVATGRMVLPQTDLVLPGSFPLVFGRTFESSYRSGRWFGPAWASTVDQRLEVDAEGVILVQPDGSLLEYPHPEPAGAPVLPTLGRRLPMTRDADGWYTVTDPETGQVRHFSDDGLLSQIDDRNGAWIAFTYEEETGAPLAISHSGGYEVRMTSAEGRITGLALADGTEILRYGYTDGHLTEVTNSSGRPLRFEYDALGRITSWTDTNDRRFDYVYDARHRCIAQSGTNGHLNVRFAYEDGVTLHTDSLGHVTRYIVNERAQVIAKIDPTGATDHYAHDAYNRLLTRTDPLGHTTRFDYDEQGRLSTVTRPDGRAIRAEYNALGLPLKVIQPDGRTTTSIYDAHGNLTSTTAPDGSTTHFGYDTRGHLASVTDALGHTTTTLCDPAGLTVAVTDPLGATTTYTRDSFGRPEVITDPLGHTTRLAWSIEGQLLQRQNPDGTTEWWTYDGEGNCLTHTDSIGGVTTSEYGDFDVLTARTGPDGVRHTYTHDTELRLTRVVNPQGLAWTYVYDPAGRIAAETDFDGRTLAYEYDPAGRLSSRTNGLGATTTYGHNALGQLVRKTTANGVTTYAYDAFDKLAEAVSPDDTTVSRQRDSAGRLVAECSDGRTVSYTYDLMGRRNSRITPTGARSEWTYDAAGRTTELVTSGRTITLERDAAGREVSRALPGSLNLTHHYDPLGRVIGQHVRDADGLTLQRRGYNYRADGHLTAIDDALAGVRTFTLDGAARVTAVEATKWTERYAYDDAGNQTSATWPTRHSGTEANGERTYTGTRITRAGAVRYEQDALGRTVLRQKTRLSRKPETWHYRWDAEDRMTGVTTPDGTTWCYRYDALSRRTAKQRLTPTGEILEEILFTWDGTTLCEQTSGPLTLTWTHDGLHPLTQAERVLGTTDDRFFAIITDLIGTPCELLDEAGSVTWRARSTLWGSTTWTRDATAYTPLRFPGQYFDPESGLHHNFFRTYDPETARYLTPDPLGLIPAPNPATYVHNPHTWSDPLGLAPCPPRVSGGGWDLRGHNPLDVVPEDAVKRILTPDANGGAQKGIEYKWTDPVSGNVARLRIHDADGTAPEGSHARNGDVYRLSVGGKYQDEAGNLYHRQVHNPRSEHYNPDAANNTHIPWPSNYRLPY
ncbi:putative T7SS-secreted protein [Streptomyces sp. NPDC001523]|uniref:putative T7SS-secreted protein n=1 Tax=Streptomyces sp. NPDC001523 TaxID=3154383 RepID=UPI003331DFE2